VGERLIEVAAEVVVDISEPGVDPGEIGTGRKKAGLKGIVVALPGGGKVALGVEKLPPSVPELAAPDVRVNLFGEPVRGEGLGEAERVRPAGCTGPVRSELPG